MQRESSHHDPVQVAVELGCNQGCKIDSLVDKVQVREAPNEQMVSHEATEKTEVAFKRGCHIQRDPSMSSEAKY